MRTESGVLNLDGICKHFPVVLYIMYCGSHATASSKIRAETSPFIINPKSDNLNIVSKLFESIQFLDFLNQIEIWIDINIQNWMQILYVIQFETQVPNSSGDFSDSSDSLPDALYFNL